MFRRLKHKCVWRRAHELKLIIRQGAEELAFTSLDRNNYMKPVVMFSKLGAIAERLEHMHGKDVSLACTKRSQWLVEKLDRPAQDHPWNKVLQFPTYKK